MLFSLVRGQNDLSTIVVQINRSGLSAPEVLLANLLSINEAQGEPIDNKWAQFLHQVQRQPRPSRPVPMKKPDEAVQPHSLNRTTDIMGEKRVEKRQQRVDGVERRPATPFAELECRGIAENQKRKDAEIAASRVTL